MAERRSALELAHRPKPVGSFVARFTYQDSRQAFEISYFEVKGKLIKQWKLIPITLAHGISMLFSDVSWERDFMVWFWEIIKLYADSNHPTDMISHPTKPGKWIFDPKSTYPMRYQKGPVPIHFCTELAPYTGVVAENHYVDDDDENTWSSTDILLAILALQAIIALPQWHHNANERTEHAWAAKTRMKILFGSMLPSIIFGKLKNAQPRDKNSAGCGGCDGFIGAITYVCMAEQLASNKGGIYKDTIKFDHITGNINAMIYRRFPVENLWRLIARPASQILVEDSESILGGVPTMVEGVASCIMRQSSGRAKLTHESFYIDIAGLRL